jgi:hypothetical protein
MLIGLLEYNFRLRKCESLFVAVIAIPAKFDPADATVRAFKMVWV